MQKNLIGRISPMHIDKEIRTGDKVNLIVKDATNIRQDRTEKVEMELLGYYEHPVSKLIGFAGLTGWGTDLKVILVAGIMEPPAYCSLNIIPFSMPIEAIPDQELIMESCNNEEKAIVMSPAQLLGENQERYPNVSIVPSILHKGLYGIKEIEGYTSAKHRAGLYPGRLRAKIIMDPKITPKRPTLKLQPECIPWDE